MIPIGGIEKERSRRGHLLKISPKIGNALYVEPEKRCSGLLEVLTLPRKRENKTYFSLLILDRVLFRFYC
jgi:hypothetical protein